MKRVIPKEENCMMCKLCEVACVVEHSESKDILEAYLVEKPRARARTAVEVDGHESISRQCRHCHDAPCLDACMNRALHRHPVSGAVQINQDKCVGCWMCIMTCPFGVIERDPQQQNLPVASKCDLCPDREIPACVENCPNRALVFEDIQ